MREAPLLETRNLTKHFKNKDGQDVVACDCINLTLHPGEALGIVGESGCGKSTFIKMLSGVLEPTSGEALFEGKSILNLSRKEQKKIHRNIQMVFQDPGTAFNPRMKIRDIITEPLINFKLIKKGDKDRVAKEYLKMVELSEDMADRYPHELSGGQRQRVGLARAHTLEPKLILCDEITSALDASVQKSIIELLKKLQKEKGIAFIYICHDLALVEQISDEIAVMYNGGIVEKIYNGSLKKTARHPYTRALLDAVLEPGMSPDTAPKVLEGEVPSFHPAMKGCVFAPRCSQAKENCRECSPELHTIGEDHEVACFLHEEPESGAEHAASFHEANKHDPRQRDNCSYGTKPSASVIFSRDGFGPSGPDCAGRSGRSEGSPQRASDARADLRRSRIQPPDETAQGAFPGKSHPDHCGSVLDSASLCETGAALESGASIGIVADDRHDPATSPDMSFSPIRTGRSMSAYTAPSQRKSSRISRLKRVFTSIRTDEPSSSKV